MIRNVLSRWYSFPLYFIYSPLQSPTDIVEHVCFHNLKGSGSLYLLYILFLQINSQQIGERPIGRLPKMKAL